MADKNVNANESEDIFSLLNKIDALLSVSDRREEIASKAVPLSEMKIDQFKEQGFIDAQLEEITKGIEHHLPIEYYAKKEINWMQMYEIRQGLIEGLDVEPYANQLFSASQMREIRLGLLDHLNVSSYAKLMLSATDMRRIRMVLFAEAYKAKKKHFGRTIKEEESGITLRISDDCMKAFIQIPDGSSDITEMQLLNFIKENEVTYGVNTEKIRNILSQKNAGKEVCIAEGKVPFEGKDGWYELFFENTIDNFCYVPPDEEIDYSSVSVIESVKPGDVLVKYHPAIKDTKGMTVTGIPVDGSPGQDLAPLTGTGIKYDAAQNLYTAAAKGCPSYNSTTNSLDIWNIFVIKGDVSYLQSLEFDGIVHILGSVRNLAVVRATGDIIIDGFVEGATVVSDHNIIIKGGVNGGEQGKIKAGGFVHGKFFENANVESRGEITSNYYLNCNLKTDSCVYAQGKKGRITGGRIEAAVGIEATIITNHLSTATLFLVGDIVGLEKRVSTLSRAREKAMDELQELELGKQKLLMLLGRDAAEGNTLYTKTCQAIYTEETIIEQNEKEIERLNLVLKRARKAYVRVRGRLDENVVFIINGSKKIIGKNITRGIVLTKTSTLGR